MSKPVIENPFKHPAEVDVSALTAKLIELLTRTIPALSVSVDLAKSDDSRAKRRKLLKEVEAAIGDEKVKELVSTNHDVHALPQCSNPDCENGVVYEDYCATCEQAIGRPCTICGGAK